MPKVQPQPRRLRFGLLVSTINGVYQSAIWQGLSEFAKRGGYDLLTFVGREINHPVYDSNDYNFIYDLAINEKLDGIFCVTATICNYVNINSTEHFIAPYRKFPLVNIGQTIAGVPSIGSNNQIGMRSLMDHLLGFHQYKRIAFIRGPATNWDAEERYATYQSALRDYGIEFDPNIVYQGYFSRDSGMLAANQMLHNGELQFEAVVAANDDMAIGALAVLQDEGYSIPTDLAVCGFDDEDNAQFIASPLTSVRQPYRQICAQAGELMLELLSGKTPSPENKVPSELVVRESCGCLTHGLMNKHYDSDDYDRALAAVVGLLQIPNLSTLEFIAKLNETLWLKNPNILHKFNWNLLLNQARKECIKVTNLQEARDNIEILFESGLSLIAQLQRRVFDRDVIFHKDLILAISDFIQNVNFGLNEDASLDALPQRLTDLNIKGFALVLFLEASLEAELPKQAMLKRIYSNDDCFADHSEGIIFNTTSAIPEFIIKSPEPQQFLFLPIVNHGLKFGYCCFEDSPTHYYVYGVIQEQLGILLNREHLAKEIIKKRTQELVESEKMSALRILVSSIAHEINTPIGTAFTASSFHLNQAEEIGKILSSGTLTKNELENFLKESREATQIIFNNLSRTNDLVQSFKKISVDSSTGIKRWFHLKEYIEDILTALSPRYRHLRIKLITECSDTLQINSYPGAFSQIMTNLIENAIVHAFHQRDSGEISNQLRMERGTLIWTFQDNGSGIPESIIPRVFEPFFTTRRSSGGSGLGLHIVYNIVTQNLRGTVTCSSVLGQGTSFIIKIPLNLEDIQY